MSSTVHNYDILTCTSQIAIIKQQSLSKSDLQYSSLMITHEPLKLKFVPLECSPKHQNLQFYKCYFLKRKIENYHTDFTFKFLMVNVCKVNKILKVSTGLQTLTCTLS